MTNLTSRVKDLLRDRYQPPEWQVAFEVQAERDEGGLRFADAIAFNTRKVSGNPLHGFEVKVSRSDWLNEVRDPTKHLAARAHCDYWWVVVGKEDITRTAELPDGVGLLTVLDDRLSVTVQATSHVWLNGDGSIIKERPPLDRRMMAAFLSRIDPMEPRAYWDSKVRDAERKGHAKGLSEAKRRSSTVPDRENPGKRKLRYNPARANFDDGEPLNTP